MRDKHGLSRVIRRVELLPDSRQDFLCTQTQEALLIRARRVKDQVCNSRLGAEAGFQTCTRAVMTHGGTGYAKEFHVKRLMREVMIARLAPVSPELILCNMAEKALGLPKFYQA